MKRVLCAVLVGAATLASCTDIPVGLETGGIAFDIHVVRAVPISTSGAQAADGAGTSQSTDSARVQLSGPGGTRSAVTSPGGTVRFDSLSVGTYSAVLEAFSGDELTHRGSVTGISVVAGETNSATQAIVLPVDIEFVALGSMIQLSGPSGTTWASDDDGVASVDASGLVTSTGNGEASITASFEGSTGSSIALVHQEVESVTVSPGAATLQPGGTQALTAEAFDSENAPVTGLNTLWVSSNHAVATVDDAGLVTAHAPGAVTISAAIGGQPGSAAITVDPATADHLAFTVQPSNVNRFGIISPAVRVEIRDASGAIVTSANDLVGIFNSTGPVDALGGTLAVNAVNGVATFSDLYMTTAGIDVVLTAVHATATEADSDPIDVGNIALLANTLYVNYIPGNSSAEASNLEQTYITLGAAVNPFTDITAAGINNALAQARMLVIPEQEIGDFNAALDAARRTAINTYVTNGGVVAVFGSSSFDLTFLNGVFGFATTRGSFTTDPVITSDADGTVFEFGPAVLPRPSATLSIAGTSLPTGSLIIYGDPGSEAAAVALIPHGAGFILYVGWDWFNAPPVGTAPAGGWIDVVRRGLGL